ncbi:hypothetical protein VTN77DRAFT_970 [Rasamsonia byssochlamydoides]|uniref:uncharacterized protein n=1 Tax=Rasamsonia byssochlamydoides TaxID=89139 RepID=UPI003743E1D3
MALSTRQSDWDSYPLPLDWPDSLTGYEFGVSSDKGLLDWDQSFLLSPGLPSSDGYSWQLTNDASREVDSNALWNPFELGGVWSPTAETGSISEYGLGLQDSELDYGILTSPLDSQNRSSERSRSSRPRQSTSLKQVPKRSRRSSRSIHAMESMSMSINQDDICTDPTTDEQLSYNDIDVCEIRPSKRLKSGPSRQSENLPPANIDSIHRTTTTLQPAQSPSKSNTSLEFDYPSPSPSPCPSPQDHRRFSIGLSSPLSSPSSSSSSFSPSSSSSSDTPSSRESGIEYRLLAASDLGQIPSITFDYDGESSSKSSSTSTPTSTPSTTSSSDDDILTPLEMPDGSIRYTVNWLPVEPGDIFI